ncbi:MAG: DUF4263 domain-containing protein [Chloroflexota bacterium]|nr:DUF4263 domain-containing protein [Chloroflexota bacterium]
MFGSEYSALHERRNWTRDEQQDFMLRRTVDDYLELIEIKTPLGGKPLFLRDEDHDTYFQHSELSKVVGQVMHYLEELDRRYYIIKDKDKENVNKIRAKINIGRDGDGQQAEALHRLNGHLHRIEVLTFDQLVRIGRRVLCYLQRMLPDEERF